MGRTALAALGQALSTHEQVFQETARPSFLGGRRADLERSEVYALLHDPDEPFRRPETIMLKDSRTATVAATTMTVNGQTVPVVYKRFHRKKWLDPLYTYFRPSRAWQAWQAGQHMASRAVPTPTNLAYLARARSFWEDPLFWYLPHETYLITLMAEPSITLNNYTRVVLPTLPPEARRNGCA